MREGGNAQACLELYTRLVVRSPEKNGAFSAGYSVFLYYFQIKTTSNI